MFQFRYTEGFIEETLLVPIMTLQEMGSVVHWEWRRLLGLIYVGLTTRPVFGSPSTWTRFLHIFSSVGFSVWKSNANCFISIILVYLMIILILIGCVVFVVPARYTLFHILPVDKKHLKCEQQTLRRWEHKAEPFLFCCYATINHLFKLETPLPPPIPINCENRM